MFDTRPALTDMALQIRACRNSKGLTLQQLATQSGVAASTIHKVESQQMVPTVAVVLKIAQGLGRRLDELIRNDASPARGVPDPAAHPQTRPTTGPPAPASAWATPRGPQSELRPSAMAPKSAKVSRIDLDRDERRPIVKLESSERAFVLIERGEVHLRAGSEPIWMRAGDCLEIEGEGTIEAAGRPATSARLTLIVSPRSDGENRVGAGQPQPISSSPLQ